MEPFKNIFSPQLVRLISFHLDIHLSSFDRTDFEASILDELQTLELKARVQLIANKLNDVLPHSPKQRNRVLRRMLLPLRYCKEFPETDDRGVAGWGVAPLSMVVGQHGVDDFERSLALLKDMTKRSTAEFDVRYFLLADQKRALKIISGWVGDNNVHVRRLVSEGTRPRLPWAMRLPKLIADPSPTVPLLHALRDDPEEYVRRSVANHLNDIAKDHPDLVADIAEEWMQDANAQRRRLIRHACRTLIKQGHKKVLEVFGYASPKIVLDGLAVGANNVDFGSAVQFSCDIVSRSRQEQSLVIDYLLHLKKANGLQSAKVFKWKTVSLGARQTISLQREHTIRPITTRRYYPGTQAISLRINGVDMGFVEFELNMPDTQLQ